MVEYYMIFCIWFRAIFVLKITVKCNFSFNEKTVQYSNSGVFFEYLCHSRVGERFSVDTDSDKMFFNIVIVHLSYDSMVSIAVQLF